MKFFCPETKIAVFVGIVFTALPFISRADNLVTMGVPLVRASHPNLTGAGIAVAQSEALDSANSPAFEVNDTTVGQPESLFDWISTNGISDVFPNDLGVESGHADSVAYYFYGPSSGIAPGVAHVDNSEADYFFQYIVWNGVSISDQIVNQSFVFFVGPPDQQPIDSAYDDYIATNGIIFASSVNGLDNGVGPPGTAYNGLGVGAYGVGAVVTDGPTMDNGRCKPDIVAPGTETSFTTPYVAGAAAILLQAAAAGDGGPDTADARDVRTVKALLLNGALKPFDWTNSTTSPLDFRYGAGVLNLYYSYGQLAGGKQGYTTETYVPSGAAHPPISSGAPVGSLAGWDFQPVPANSSQDTVNHYLFQVSSNATLTTTLVWERHAGETNINNLALFLYNAGDASLLASSVSLVDNVQHLYLPFLVPGEYDLEVVTDARAEDETYALAFQFFGIAPPSLSVAAIATNTVVTWPWSPTLYILQQTASLSPPNWTNVSAQEWITNTTVLTSINNSGNAAYFRLVR